MQITTAHDSIKERRSFRCAHCSHSAEAEVTGIGEGTQSALNPAGTAERRATEDARKDVERAIHDVRCQKCGLRPPGADMRFWRPWALMFVAFWVAGFIAGMLPTWLDLNMAEHDRRIAAWVLPLILGGTATLIVPIVVLGKLSVRDARVKWL